MNKKPVLLIIMIFLVELMCGQTISVISDQPMQYGSFYLSGDSVGTVTISGSGTRSANGNLHLASSSYQAATFTISTESLTDIKVQADRPIINLTNSLGESIVMETGIMNPEFATVRFGFPMQVFVGGVISTDMPISAGGYSGELLITFSIFYE